MKTHCKEKVYGSFMLSGTTCYRPAGYGLDEAYCKQHARLHPADGKPLAMTTTLYKSKSSYGGKADTIVAVPAANVTEHTFINSQGRRESLVTTYDRHYPTWIEANAALIKKEEKRLCRAMDEQAEAEKTLKELHARVDPTKPVARKLKRS